MELITKKAAQTGVPYGTLKGLHDAGQNDQDSFANIVDFLTGKQKSLDLWESRELRVANLPLNPYDISVPKMQRALREDNGFYDYVVSNNEMDLDEENLILIDMDELCELFYWYENTSMTLTEARWQLDEENITEAEYQGKKVKLGDPFRTKDGNSKFSVYVKNDKGNVVKVNFGDPDMEIKRDDPDRRKNFRARHKCDSAPGPKWKARYWSCKMWEKGKSVSDVTEQEIEKDYESLLIEQGITKIEGVKPVQPKKFSELRIKLDESSTSPPGYRVGNETRSCNNCTSFDNTQNMCHKYDQQVASNHICDTWKQMEY